LFWREAGLGEKHLSDLTPKILELVARLKAEGAPSHASDAPSRPEVLGTAPPAVSRRRVPAPVVLRQAYRRWFELTVAEADGQRISPAEAEALHQQILKLTDDAGPLWADAVFADELRRFRWETARCGLCGGLGHDRDEGGPHAR
jgi:hypothetical protein